MVNAVYGAPQRLTALAADLVNHWEGRREAMRPLISAPGKALIVGATSEICARLYKQIIELRPDWHSPELHQGRIKVVYSGDASDTELIGRHVRRESENAVIKERLRQVDDELEIVIVKDMMLTGYDSPPLHTLYLDRPLKGALLMQTLARVNRTFRQKNAGLLVVTRRWRTTCRRRCRNTPSATRRTSRWAGRRRTLSRWSASCWQRST